MKRVLLLSVLVALLCSGHAVATLTGGGGSGFGVNVIQLLLCPWGNECDDFTTDASDWTEYGQGWSITDGVARSESETPFGETFFMRTAGEGPRSLDNCQLGWINEPIIDAPAPGFVLYSSGVDPESSDRLDLVFAFDVFPVEIALRSSTGGATTVQEDSYINFEPLGTSPYLLGACINVTTTDAVVNVYDFGDASAPADPADWTPYHVVELNHDAVPAIGGSLGGYGLRNWSGDATYSDAEFTAWAIIDDETIAPPNMKLTPGSVSASAVVGNAPADKTFDISNNGGGTFDWDASVRDSIDDCLGTGGANWVTIASPNTGTGVAAGSPDTVTVDFDQAAIANCGVGSHVAQFSVDGSNGSPSAVQNATNTLVVTLNIGEEAPPGSYPANNPSVWGHLHPDCDDFGTFGTCPATVGDDETISNCTVGGAGDITFTGDNATASCVYVSSNNPSLIDCANSGGCKNTLITKSTFIGGGASNETVGLRLTTNYGSGSDRHTLVVEKSVFEKHRVGIALGGGRFIAPDASIETGFAFVARENIFRDPQWPPTAHSEHVALVESVNGALFENNVFDCNFSFNGNNPCNTAHMLGQPHNGAVIQNVTIRGNRFIGDSSDINGYEFTFDAHPGEGCMQPIQFHDNVIEQNGNTGIWNTSGCAAVGSRPGSSCTGNTVDGLPLVNCY